MAHAKITLIGFYNYMDSIGDDLFKHLSTPAGIDKTLLINNILMMGGEYEVLWGDPFFYQNMIGVWSDKWQHTMEKWYEAINAYFNPVENYDRMEDWVDNSSKQSSGNVKNNETQTRNEDVIKNETAVASDSSSSTGGGTTTNKRSAYDSSNYEPHDQSETSTSGNNISNGITTANGDTKSMAVASNENNQQMSNSDTTSGIHSGRIHGNIGVKTAQSMIEESLALYGWNLYDAIAELFIGEMLIYVDD